MCVSHSKHHLNQSWACSDVMANRVPADSRNQAFYWPELNSKHTHTHSRELGHWQQLLCSPSDCYWLGPMQSCLTGLIWDQWQMDNLSWRLGYHRSSRRQVNLVRAPWSPKGAYSVIARFNSGDAFAHTLIHTNTHLQTNVVWQYHSQTPWPVSLVL